MQVNCGRGLYSFGKKRRRRSLFSNITLRFLPTNNDDIELTEEIEHSFGGKSSFILYKQKKELEYESTERYV